MPLDGSYGRLGAHKNRLKQLASRKRQKTDMSKFVGSYTTGRSIDVTPADPKVLEAIREERRRENLAKRRADLILFIIALAISIGIGIYLYDFIFLQDFDS